MIREWVASVTWEGPGLACGSSVNVDSRVFHAPVLSVLLQLHVLTLLPMLMVISRTVQHPCRPVSF